MQNLARDQAARLLDESDNLVKLAQDKVEGWQTLDALLLFKSAQEKTSRADVTSQEMSGMSYPLKLSCEYVWVHTHTHKQTHTHTYKRFHPPSHAHTPPPSLVITCYSMACISEKGYILQQSSFPPSSFLAATKSSRTTGGLGNRVP